MEKRTRHKMNSTIRVAITGPECTGKSTLAMQLARHFNTRFIPEYAREYIEQLDHPYTFENVAHVAEVQVKQAKEILHTENKIVFFDTYLIITKVWFQVVYGHYPDWINEELKQKTMDLYLLCDTSIPWVADKVRENGGEMREILYNRYLAELKEYGFNYAIITGTGNQRLNNAIDAVNHFFPDIYPANS